MAVLVKNNSGSGWTVPTKYGGGNLAWGESQTIEGDTLANVQAAFGGAGKTAGKLEFRQAPDGQPGNSKQLNAVFVSAEQTGTGALQSIPHGLGVVPSNVVIMPTDLSPATVGQYTVVEGAHDVTNIKVTVTTGKKFKIHAEP